MRNLLRAQTAADTNNIPLYPRPVARDACAEAVRGEVVVGDTTTWRDVRGQITVKADRLQTGQAQRDGYTHESVLETKKYPDISFAIDSLAGTMRKGDTLHTSAIGALSLHGASRPMAVAIRIWPEAGGLRVVGKFRIPAPELVDHYGLSSSALGLGVGVRIWHFLYMGVDLLMRAEAEADS